jgi:hypothetical protein
MLRLNQPLNVTVFVVDPGDKGRSPFVSENIDFSKCKNLTEADQHLSEARAVLGKPCLHSEPGKGLDALESISNRACS